MLSLYKLEIFAAVIQEGSFSAAAKRLPMTQPAVSQHIQDLETALGTQLFNRNRRGAVLTAAGEVLYDYTQRILALVNEAEASVTAVGSLASGQVSVMATPGINVYLLPSWISAFRSRYPNLAVVLHTGVTQEVAAAVANQSTDLGFVEGEMDGINLSTLGRVILRDVEMLLVVCPSHPFAGRASIAPDALNGEPFITRQPYSRTRIFIDRLMHRLEVTPRIVGEFDNPEAIKQSILAGMGVGILPEYAVQREVEAGMLAALRLEGVPMQRQISLLYDTSRALTPIASALLQELSSEFPALNALWAMNESES
ncbi:MAG: LysR family transcriptional regulator [Anaerolineae bacterium]